MLSDKLGKAVSATIILLIISGVLLVVISTHGYLWSVQSLRYRLILESLAEPPGLMPETGFVQAFPEYPLGLRYFNVKGQYSETVSFFRTEVPKQGWVLSNIDEADNDRDPLPRHGLFTILQFTNQSNYCLKINVATAIDQKGSQLDDEISVGIQIWNNTECRDLSGYSNLGMVQN